MENKNQKPGNHIDYFAPKILWFIIGVLLFVVIVSSASLFQIKMNYSELQSTGQTPIHDIANIPTHPFDTSTWKTYTNSQYGFELKYPNNYIVQLNPDERFPSAFGLYVVPQVVKNDVGMQIVIIPDTVDNYSSKIISNANIAFPVNHLQVRAGSLDNKPTKTIKYTTGANSPYTAFNTLIQVGDNVYEFGYLDLGPNSIESQILSTFKFTTSTPDNCLTRGECQLETK